MSGRRWIADDGSLIYGRHRGEQVTAVAQDDPGYLRWALEAIDDMDPECRKVMETLLARRGEG